MISVVLPFTLPLGRLVVPIGATDARAEQTVMASIMTDNATDDRAPDASLGLRRTGCRERQQGQRGNGRHDYYFLHDGPPNESKRASRTWLVLLNDGRAQIVQSVKPRKTPEGSYSGYFQIGLPVPGRP